LSRFERYDATFTPDAGVVHYAPPEQFEDIACTGKVDVFSFGLIPFEIPVDRPFFAASMRRFAVRGHHPEEEH
jgi:hypothetical protein